MKKESFYSVHAGARPGVYSTWKECETQVKGVSRSVYKRFDSEREAELFLKCGRVGTEAKDKVNSKKKPRVVISKAKKIQNAGVLRVGHTFASTSVKSRSLAQVLELPNNDSHKGSVEVIYTDGSSRGNGKLGARAGVGVFFGEGDLRNVSERLSGNPQTNQRAELTAAIRALEKATPGKRIEIRTDSRYLINGIKTWLPGWKKKKWITSTGTVVKNRDLFEKLDSYIRTHSLNIDWVHVSAHTGMPGNEKADQLAVAGAYLD